MRAILELENTISPSPQKNSTFEKLSDIPMQWLIIFFLPLSKKTHPSKSRSPSNDMRLYFGSLCF